MVDGPARVAARLDAELRARADPARAEHDRGYLHSDLVHLGVAVPAVRSVARAHVRAARPGHDELVALVEQLWADEVYEHRLLGVELVLARPAAWTTDDLAWFASLLRRCHTWALVDGLAIHGAGRVVARDAAGLATIDGWVCDPDRWVRRSSVLALLGLVREGREWPRFERYADSLLDEQEFFVRKALGWVAREASRRHPELVAPWVSAHLDRMNAVTIREAVTYLPEGPELLAAWRSGVPRSRRPGRSSRPPGARTTP